VKEARNQIKRPYKYGGESPKGFDCSGLVQYVYSKNGIQLPRRSADQARYGKSISIGQARPGDLIFFKSGGKINHVGIVSDTRGKYPSMVHSSSSAGVSEVDLDTSDYWRKRYAYIRRM
jgi:cell wall-associated NlpC family hydrolase